MSVLRDACEGMNMMVVVLLLLQQHNDHVPWHVGTLCMCHFWAQM